MTITSLTRRGLLAGSAAIAASPAFRAQAQGVAPGGAKLRIGVLNDMSGVYRDATGPTSAICAGQAVEDFKAAGGGTFEIEVLTGDHQNKPDVGIEITRQWLDREGVDMILDVPTSSVALAVNAICKEKNKAYVNCGGATTDLTGKDCTPNIIHWSYDTAMLSAAVGGALTRQGGDSWYFITADYVFGHQLERDTTEVVRKLGGKVLGSAPYPFPNTRDFSSFLLAAQASGAKVIGLANAGEDTINCTKQAHEFGITGSGVKLAALLGSLTTTHGVGLEQGQGLILTESFYWDLNDRTRAFAKRVTPKTPKNWPNAVHAGCYGGTFHYLKSVAALGLGRAKADGAAVVAHMRANVADDDAFGTTHIRADGRAMVTPYLFQAKAPSESKGEWDLYKLIGKVEPNDAAPPLSACPLVKV
jgi:branched-chain amino acid transport system substrate-binding protein